MSKLARLIWLASYPKSGNTWLRSLFSAYGLTGAPKTETSAAVDIRALGSEMAASRVNLDAALGLPTADFARRELCAARRLAYFEWAARWGQSDQALIVKAHDAYARTPAGEPMFPLEVTRAIVHVVRDPRDVVVSAHHHWALSLDATIDRLNNPDDWLAFKADAGTQVPQWMSDWSTHARSWLAAPGPRITLKYEDLLATPEACFSQVLAVCGLAVDVDRVSQAVAACRIDVLREQECKHGFPERRSDATAPFFREGRAGGWREVLSPAQVRRIEALHRPMMDQLGYE